MTKFILAAITALAFVAWQASAAEPCPKQLTFNTNGVLLHWEGDTAENSRASSASAGELRYGGKVLKLVDPCSITSEPDAIIFTYRWTDEPLLEVSIRHALSDTNNAVTWTRRVKISSSVKLASDLTVSLESGLPSLPPDTWLPLINGVGASLGTKPSAAYHFAGILPTPVSETRLALPMVSVPAEAQHFTLATDIDFSTLFTAHTIEWTYPAAVGLENGSEQRTIVLCSHRGTPDESLDRFFCEMLSDVPPGPEWLHEIALVGYDYMSDQGQGWFRDIDALCQAIPEADRHKVLLCCHGWYDYIGRYCFDAKTGQLDNQWTAFSNYENVKSGPRFFTLHEDHVRNDFENSKPVAMSLEQVHRRLAYARSRGFRVALYFADGLNAGKDLDDFAPDRVLRWGGWQGPDSKGSSYIQNPLHPQVHSFYRDYVRALLAEFGHEIDLLNWDETFHVPVGCLGSEALPGYADRAMMCLARDVRRIVDDYNLAHNRRIAFLASDCLGVGEGNASGSYALATHGTFQDSWCHPDAWFYSIFPNYRNVVWSCCWWAINKWSWIDFGVRNYQAPVVVTNGWGDDTGFAEMTPEHRQRVIDLFNVRKDKLTQIKWFEQLPVYSP